MELDRSPAVSGTGYSQIVDTRLISCFSSYVLPFEGSSIVTSKCHRIGCVRGNIDRDGYLPIAQLVVLVVVGFERDSYAAIGGQSGGGFAIGCFGSGLCAVCQIGNIVFFVGVLVFCSIGGKSHRQSGCRPRRDGQQLHAQTQAQRRAQQSFPNPHDHISSPRLIQPSGPRRLWCGPAPQCFLPARRT